MKTKKIVSAIASVALVLGLCPATALATEADDTNVGGGVADFIVSPADDATVGEPNALPTQDSENVYESILESSYANSEELSFSAVPLATDDIASGELGTCTWVIDSEGCLTIAPADGVSGEFELTDPKYDSWPWYDYRASITSAKVESGVSAIGSLAYMFYYCSSLTSLDLSNFDTSNVTSMSDMFVGCSSLVSLDLSSLDTSNVTSMNNMFGSFGYAGLCSCSSLTSLDLSNLDTSNVTNMSSMFYYCSSLTSLDVSSFDTSNVTSMYDMFIGCSSLTSLNLSGLDTSNVANMSGMFSGCTSLTSLDLSSFDTSNVTSGGIFSGCSYLRSVTVGEKFAFSNAGYLPVPTRDNNIEGNWYNSDGVVYDSPSDMPDYIATTYTAVFPYITSGTLGTCVWQVDDEGCLIIEPADGVSGSFEVEITNSINGDDPWPWWSCRSSITSVKVEPGVSASGSLAYMFYYFRSLTSLDLSGLDTSNVTSMSYMFYYASCPASLDLSYLDTSNVTDMSWMFAYCSFSASFELSLSKTSYATDMNHMFFGCESLTSIDLSNFDTSNVTNMSCMFYMTGLTSVDLSPLDTSKVTIMNQMFYGCEYLTSVNFGSINTSNVTTMARMFEACYTLTTIDLSTLDLSSVTNMTSMFWACWALTSADLHGIKFGDGASLWGLFQACRSLTSVDLSGVDTSGMIDMSRIFYGCSSLVSLDLSSFDTSNATSMSEMFAYSALASLDMSNFDTSNVMDMGGMFAGCSSLASLDLSGFDTSNVTDMSFMFYNCSSLASLDLSGFVTSNVTDMSNMFSGCSNLRSVTVGEGFAFTEDAYLPVPTLNGIEGKWRDSNGIIYDDPSDLPNNVATTYTVVFVDVFNDAGADISDLMTEVAEAEAFNSADYTEESWGVMQMSLISARAVLDDPNASQVEVDSATAALSAAIAALVPTSGTQEKTMTVYAGENRWETANLIAAAVAEQGTYSGVIVCSGVNGKYADALSASGLSGVLDYPVVLTDGSLDALDGDTASAISTLLGNHKGNIVILGGENTVSEGIASGLATYGTVTRVAGEDRYATSQKVYEYGSANGGWSTNYAVLAIGNNFPDALGAASFCTTNAAPMLLTNRDSATLESYVQSAVSGVGKVVIAGGTSSISDQKITGLGNTVRLAGEDRYATNIEFADWALNNGMAINAAGVATGTSFPDSLGSSYLLSLTNSVLLLSSPDDNSALYTLLSGNASSINAISVFGGTNSVSADTRTAIQSAIGGDWNTVNK